MMSIHSSKPECHFGRQWVVWTTLVCVFARIVTREDGLYWVGLLACKGMKEKKKNPRATGWVRLMRTVSF